MEIPTTSELFSWIYENPTGHFGPGRGWSGPWTPWPATPHSQENTSVPFTLNFVANKVDIFAELSTSPASGGSRILKGKGGGGDREPSFQRGQGRIPAGGSE